MVNRQTVEQHLVDIFGVLHPKRKDRECSNLDLHDWFRMTHNCLQLHHVDHVHFTSPCFVQVLLCNTSNNWWLDPLRCNVCWDEFFRSLKFQDVETCEVLFCQLYKHFPIVQPHRPNFVDPSGSISCFWPFQFFNIKIHSIDYFVSEIFHVNWLKLNKLVVTYIHASRLKKVKQHCQQI